MPASNRPTPSSRVFQRHRRSIEEATATLARELRWSANRLFDADQPTTAEGLLDMADRIAGYAPMLARLLDALNDEGDS